MTDLNAPVAPVGPTATDADPAVPVEAGAPVVARRRRWPGRRLPAAAPPSWARHQYATVVAFVVVIGLVVPEVMTSRQDQFNTNLWIAYSIAGVGFYWMVGLAGRAAFSQTFMMALGGYTSAWVTRELGEEAFLVGVAVAMVATGALAAVIALVVRKAQLFFFAIASMAVTQIGIQVFNQATGFTGPNGTQSGISPPIVFGKEYLQNDEIFPLFLVALLLVLLLAAAIERSPLRRDAIAARDNPLVARVSGVATVRVQVVFFAIGSSLGGLSGALIGHWNGVIGTDSFGFDLSIGIFLMLYLGGVGSMWGPVIGGAFYVALPQFLSSFERYNTIIYGGLLLVVILSMPRGLVGVIESAAGLARRLVRRSRTEVAGAER